jgi:hypothetical protein
MNLNLKIILILFLILITSISLSNKELFNPGHKQNTAQIETSTNLSNFKKLDKSAFAMILDINSYMYNKNVKVCNGPRGCKNYTTKEYGFKPEEIKEYKINHLVKNGQVSNENMIPFLVEALKECHKNIKSQNDSLKEIKKKIDEIENQ